MKKAYASPGFSHGQLVSLLRLFFLGLLHSVFAILLWCNELGHHWPLLSSPNTPSIRFPARLDVESGRLPFFPFAFYFAVSVVTSSRICFMAEWLRQNEIESKMVLRLNGRDFLHYL